MRARICAILAVFAAVGGTALVSTLTLGSASAATYPTRCKNYWYNLSGWSGAFNWTDSLYVGYCHNGARVWHRYGTDCGVDVA